MSAPLILVISNRKSIDSETSYVWFSLIFTNYSLVALDKACQTPEPQVPHLLNWDLKAYFKEAHCEGQVGRESEALSTVPNALWVPFLMDWTGGPWCLLDKRLPEDRIYVCLI